MRTTGGGPRVLPPVALTVGPRRVEFVDGVGWQLGAARQAPAFRPRRGTLPRPGLGLLGRAEEIETAQRAADLGVPIEFWAPCGYGKTTLLRHLADALPARLGRVAVYLDARDLDATDVASEVVARLYAVSPRARATAEDCWRLLGELAPVVLLDEPGWDGRELDQAISLLEGASVIIASGEAIMPATGWSRRLPGLHTDDAASLIGRLLGRRLSGAEVHDAHVLAVALDGSPHRLRQVAALSRREAISLGDVARELDRDAEALQRWSGTGLTPADHRVLCALALLGGALLPPGLVGLVGDVREIHDLMADLRDRGLVLDGEGGRVGLDACSTEAWWSAIGAHLDVGSAIRDLVDWFTAQDPTAADTLSGAQAAISVIRFAAEAGEWEAVIALTRVVEPILTLAGRLDAARRVLEAGHRCARAGHDGSAQRYFSDQLDVLDELAGLAAPPTGGPGPAPDRWQPPRGAGLTLAAAITGLLVIGTWVASADPSTGTGGGSASTATAIAVTPSTTSTPPSPSPPLTSSSTTTPARPTGPRIISVSGVPRVNVSSKLAQPTVTARIRNAGEAKITLQPSRVVGGSGFRISRDCPPQLPARATCAVVLAFDPALAGPSRARLIVSDTEGRTASRRIVGVGYHLLTVSLSGPGTIRVQGSDQVSSCSASCGIPVTAPNVTLTAQPACSGCVFTGWKAGRGRSCSGKVPTCSLAVTQDDFLGAGFLTVPTTTPPSPPPQEP